MSLSDFVRWSEYATSVSEAALLLELLWLGLARRYLWLTAFILGGLLQGIFTIGVSPHSRRYAYIYYVGQAAKLIFAVALSIQLWQLALASYPALARFGRRVLMYLLIGSALVAAGGLFFEPTRSGIHAFNAFPHYFNAFEGAVDFMTVAFLVAAAAFLLWFPVEVSRNVAALMGGFVFYSLQRRVLLFLLNAYPGSSRMLSEATLILELCCLVLWMAMVRRQGETLKTVTGHRWNPAEAARLLKQLDAINTRLQEMARVRWPRISRHIST